MNSPCKFFHKENERSNYCQTHKTFGKFEICVDGYAEILGKPHTPKLTGKSVIVHVLTDGTFGIELKGLEIEGHDGLRCESLEMISELIKEALQNVKKVGG